VSSSSSRVGCGSCRSLVQQQQRRRLRQQQQEEAFFM
jgi:hypothetical protein